MRGLRIVEMFARMGIWDVQRCCCSYGIVYIRFSSCVVADDFDVYCDVLFFIVIIVTYYSV